MPRSRRADDDDEERSDDDDRRRRRRSREEDKPFPLVLVLVLIFVPILGVGAYFGIKAVRKGGSSNQAEEVKISRAKIIGHWVHDHGGGGRTELTIQEDDKMTVAVSMPNAGRSITTSYHVVEAGKNTITIRLAESVHDGGPVDFVIEIVSEQQLRVAISTEKSQPKIYTKQAAPKKAGKKVGL